MRRSLSAGRGRLHAVILAGGAGERFWPRSRRELPKPLLEVADGRSLLAATVARARRFASPDCVWLICGHEHATRMKRASGLPARRILVEPRRRNTAMAVGLGATRILAEDPGAVLAVLPADHRIPDARAFAQAIRRAARAARDAQVLVTLGVRPTRPDTGYGYIQRGEAAGRGFPGLHLVRRFVEKPNEARARRYWRSGGYLWNAGIFIWSARVILEEIEVCAPEIHRALAAIRRTPRGRAASAAIQSAYRRAPSLPVDVAVLERSRRVWTLPVGFRWSDVGTWGSLADELGMGPAGNRILAGDVVAHEAAGNLVWGDRRLIALVGVDDLAVVDTGDALLIVKLERSSEVKKVVGKLRARKRRHLT